MMKRTNMLRWRQVLLLVALMFVSTASVAAQEMVFQVDPAQSSVAFTLGDV